MFGRASREPKAFPPKYRPSIMISAGCRRAYPNNTGKTIKHEKSTDLTGWPQADCLKKEGAASKNRQ